MIYSEYLEADSHSTKWDRVRVNHGLLVKILIAKEHTDNYNVNNQFNQSKTLNHESRIHGSSRNLNK